MCRDQNLISETSERASGQTYENWKARCRPAPLGSGNNLWVNLLVLMMTFWTARLTDPCTKHFDLWSDCFVPVVKSSACHSVQIKTCPRGNELPLSLKRIREWEIIQGQREEASFIAFIHLIFFNTFVFSSLLTNLKGGPKIQGRLNLCNALNPKCLDQGS